MSRPRLRPLEAFPVDVDDGDGAELGVRDPTGLSDVVLLLSRPALEVMALMDGDSTCDEIRRKFHSAFGQELPETTLRTMLEHLDQAHFLEGASFESYCESLRDQYRNLTARPMPDAAALGIVDDSGELFHRMLETAKPVTPPGPILGLVAPHLDYPRGEPCYASAYGALRHGQAPERVVVLGTNHFGRSTGVVATAHDFASPLGVTRTDKALIERLESRFGSLRQHEMDHAREHSIELQVAWCQHLFGAAAFQLVPILCPDPCGPNGTASCDGEGVDLADFGDVLGELIREDEVRTLLIAGADLSHVGAAFGDHRPLDDAFLDEVRQHDRRALDLYADNDPDAFVRCLSVAQNPTRVCSAGCMYVLAKALPLACVTVADYHQAVDQPSQTCVTCTAVLLTQPA